MINTFLPINKPNFSTSFSETVFCNQISKTEYQKQTEECTNKSLVSMMNSIIDNPKIALKEKKQRLHQFRKYHPHIYSKNFVGMVE